LQWVKQYERSGQSMREFCLENDLAYATLSLWRREVGRAGEGPPPASLMEVRVGAADAAYGALKVRVKIFQDRGLFYCRRRLKRLLLLGRRRTFHSDAAAEIREGTLGS